MGTEERSDTEEIESSQILYEDWRYIPLFEGIYIISNRGRILAMNRIVVCNVLGKNLSRPYQSSLKKIRIKRNGYCQVSLYGIDFHRTYSIHRLVMLAFAGPMPEGCEVVMHLDDNPQNNSVYNLRYGTYSDNMQDCVAKGRHAWFGTARSNNQIKNLTIYAYDLGGNLLHTFKNLGQASRTLNLNSSSIRSSANRKTAHKGFNFRYADECFYKIGRIKRGTPIVQIRLGEITNEFINSAEAMKATGINNQQILDACRNKGKIVGGFEWAFK